VAVGDLDGLFRAFSRFVPFPTRNASAFLFLARQYGTSALWEATMPIGAIGELVAVIRPTACRRAGIGPVGWVVVLAVVHFLRSFEWAA
jgi:hypothetical protein